MDLNKTVVLGVTGGIAAYKSADIISRLKKKGIHTFVIMTKHAGEFITPLTMQTLSGNPVVIDMFENPKSWDIEHISLAKKADCFLIAPASANFIGKLAAGIADDMLTTTVMATKAPVVIAPAMNTNMYTNPIVQGNISKLNNLGYEFIMPSTGLLACGDTGVGKLADVTDIVSYIENRLFHSQDLQNKTIMVTAGPTREYLDPVRYISNPSSGKMGFSLAKAALQRGAEVILISGPTSLSPPDKATYITVESTQEMYDAVMEFYKSCDMVIKSAAPVDFRAKEIQQHKLKKDTIKGDITIDFIKNPDILMELGKRKTKQFLIGFAAESQNVVEYAKKKLIEKNLDMIVANNVMEDGAGFQTDTNVVKILKRNGEIIDFPQMTKYDLAHKILTQAIDSLNH